MKTINFTPKLQLLQPGTKRLMDRYRSMPRGLGTAALTHSSQTIL